MRCRITQFARASVGLCPFPGLYVTEFELSDRNLGCVRLGNPDLDFQNLNLDFPIEREIRKRISPPRNPSSRWISIKKSKSRFFGFAFLSFDWEIRKRICKTVLVNSGLLFTNYACACKTAVPKDSFANPFSDFPIERQKGKSKKSGFGFLN